MKKVKNKKNIDVRKVLVLITIIFIVCTLTTSIFAEITRTSALEKSDIAKISKNATIGFFGEVTINLLVTSCKFFVHALMALLTWIFRAAGLGQGLDNDEYTPTPALIIFNTIPMLDPNFINPYDPARGGPITILNIIAKAISPIYYSSIIFVSGLFSVIALLIGIKLMISVSPSEKAQYKTSVMTWITGLVLLYSGHIIMAGIFYLNEKITETLYSAESEAYEIETYVVYDTASALNIDVGHEDRDALSEAHKVIAGIPAEATEGMDEDDIDVKAVLEDITKNTEIKFEMATGIGYEGLMASYYARMVYYNDGVCTIAVCIMIGQTFALLILYVKRLVFAMALGLIYPYVIGIDTFKKVKGGKAEGLFEKWLKQFSLTVFMQSLHAFIMYLVIKFVNQINLELQELFLNNNPPKALNAMKTSDSGASNKLVMIFSIIEVALVSSITKIEDLVREFAGMEKAKIGDAKTAAAQGLVTLSALRTGGKSVADNFSGTTSRIRNTVTAGKNLKSFDSKNGITKGKKTAATGNTSAKSAANAAASKATASEMAAKTVKETLMKKNTKKSTTSTSTADTQPITFTDIKSSLGDNKHVNKPLSKGKTPKSPIYSAPANTVETASKMTDVVTKAAGLNSPSLNVLGMKLDRIADNIAKIGAANNKGTDGSAQVNTKGPKYVVDPNITNPKLKDYKDQSTGRSLADDRKELVDKYNSAMRETFSKGAAAIASVGFVPTSIAIAAGATDNLHQGVFAASKMIQAADAMAEATGRIVAQPATTNNRDRIVIRETSAPKTDKSINIEDK